MQQAAQKQQEMFRTITGPHLVEETVNSEGRFCLDLEDNLQASMMPPYLMESDSYKAEGLFGTMPNLSYSSHPPEDECIVREDVEAFLAG